MSLANVAVIVAMAATIPLLARAVPGGVVPGIVIEILAGLLVGPHGLGWVSIDGAASTLALLGVAFLFFLAGLEIDLGAIRGGVLLRSVGAYCGGLVLALVVTVAMHAAGLVQAPVLLAVALSATGLGLVVPLLRDAQLLGTPTGGTIASAASVAEFSAVVILAVGFGAGRSPLLSAAFLAVLVVLTLVVTIAGRRLDAETRLTAVVDRLSDGTGQLRVRISVALVIGFAALAQLLGLEVVLGAFFAGGILNVLDHGMRDPAFRGRLDGIGYGFLIPIFFIVSGSRLDLGALNLWPDLLVVVPLLTLALLVARGVPTPLLGLPRRARVGSGLLLATSLPFIVTASQVGLEQGRLDTATAAAVTTAGLVGVCIFPTLGVSALAARNVSVRLVRHGPG
ncbi:cation:proton antiporter [Cellulomonas sp. McL0617]|uniref:cation:proton antiporter n=1 Tax=Cellulomonas sp. McL0617 TaxID=3415675 RepID=UPI003CEBF210